MFTNKKWFDFYKSEKILIRVMLRNSMNKRECRVTKMHWPSSCDAARCGARAAEAAYQVRVAAAASCTWVGGLCETEVGCRLPPRSVSRQTMVGAHASSAARAHEWKSSAAGEATAMERKRCKRLRAAAYATGRTQQSHRLRHCALSLMWSRFKCRWMVLNGCAYIAPRVLLPTAKCRHWVKG